MTPLVEDVQKFVVVNLEQLNDLLLGGVLNFLNHFRNIALGLTGRLNKRNCEERADDVPLVTGNPPSN